LLPITNLRRVEDRIRQFDVLWQIYGAYIDGSGRDRTCDLIDNE